MTHQTKETVRRFGIHIDTSGYVSMQEQFNGDWYSAADYEALKVEIDRAYQMLEANGVPRERARHLANGIDVLTTRMRKENNALTAERDQAHNAAVEECIAVCEKVEDEYTKDDYFKYPENSSLAPSGARSCAHEILKLKR